ncbi:MAG: hypothetical protein KIY12_06885 [Thermoplasmata archaeon]|jgi:hypothetical protein|uniref:Uncharacterized protein n=1 Tax=Candidatus Sysuiplasma superficiale TaxID=2823368 RepID=A0A8J8CEB8_9ARCH|nr:hypothetical protein [Candidatus Sysuiplasma superficiale]
MNRTDKNDVKKWLQANKVSGVSYLPNGVVALNTNAPYKPGVGLMTTAYQSKTVVGDPNDPGKIEAIQCDRCKKWIPAKALLDYEKGINKDSMVHHCPVGRTGGGGIHMYNFGNNPSNPSVTLTMKPIGSVEPYELETPYIPHSSKPDGKFRLGERARIIFNGKRTVGTLVSIGKIMTPTMPEFELEDGKHVFGNECWWLPLDLAEKVEVDTGAHP